MGWGREGRQSSQGSRVSSPGRRCPKGDMSSVPAGGQWASGCPSLAPLPLGTQVMRGAPSHLPDHEQISPLVLPKLVRVSRAPGLAPCRARGCRPPSSSHATAGSALRRHQSAHAAPCWKPFPREAVRHSAGHSSAAPSPPAPCPTAAADFRSSPYLRTSRPFGLERPCCCLLCFTQNTPTHTVRPNTEAPPPRSLP